MIRNVGKWAFGVTQMAAVKPYVAVPDFGSRLCYKPVGNVLQWPNCRASFWGSPVSTV